MTLEETFPELSMAQDISEEDVAGLVVEKLEETDEGRAFLETYAGPLPTLSTARPAINSFLKFLGRPVWVNSDHSFGYLAPQGETLVNASDIESDPLLIDRPLDVMLHRLRAFDYPGRGEMQVLLQFAANHFVEGREEQPQFTHTYVTRDGQAAGMTGYPIFLNIRPGRSGLAFRVGTVLAENSGDRDILEFLNSDAFRQGLDLAGSFSPALKMVGQFASGIFGAVAKRNRNRGVQRFELGLGFQDLQVQAKLREGTYFAVQVPSKAEFDWRDWRFDRNSGVVVRADHVPGSPPEDIPFNYLAFTISTT